MQKNFSGLSGLGYSMGAIIAYEIVLRQLVGTNICHLFLCSQEDLRINSISNNRKKLNEDEMIEHFVRLGGIDTRLLRNKKFLLAMMEPLKHDYELRMQYRFENYLENRVSCNTTILYSSQDILTEHILGWKEIIVGNVDIVELGTNHFFIKDNAKDVSDIIVHKLV